MSVGLICEFNPFHYGHEYIIRKIHELTNQPVVCIMSGPFVQRGEPACADKYSRTKAALLGGADAVIELPVKFATASAKNFALGGVSVLKNVQGISALAFGVETDDVDILYKIAHLKKLPKTNELIKSELSSGISYPNAIANAIAKSSDNPEHILEVLDKPNNVLAIEYIEALDGSSIKPLPIRRQGNGYNDTSLNGSFASATAIRKGLICGQKNLSNFLPQFMLNQCLSNSVNTHLFESLMLYSARRLSLDELKSLSDVENGLEHSIKKAALAPSFGLALEQLKSKRYTYSRLKRIFLHAMLGLNNQVMSDINSVKTRVLGIKKEFKPFLADINSNIITRNSEATEDFTQDQSVIIDAFAEDVYSLLTGREANLYYKTPMIII